MKKVNILAMVVSILFVFLAINSFAEETALKVTAKNGKVLVQTYPSKTWTELTVGQVVHPKDIIKTDICDITSKETGKQFIDANGNTCPVCGAATLVLPDKSSVSIKPDSEISIDELVLNDAGRKLKINMTKGELRMIIAKVNTPSDFTVKTPNAIYGATGTIFYVKDSSTGSNVYVGDGSINVVNPKNGKTYSVIAGMTMGFNPNGTFSGPTPASGVDISNWTRCYTNAVVEPYTPPSVHPHVTPPHNTPERPVSGG